MKTQTDYVEEYKNHNFCDFWLDHFIHWGVHMFDTIQQNRAVKCPDQIFIYQDSIWLQDADSKNWYLDDIVCTANNLQSYFFIASKSITLDKIQIRAKSSLVYFRVNDTNCYLANQFLFHSFIKLK